MTTPRNVLVLGDSPGERRLYLDTTVDESAPAARTVDGAAGATLVGELVRSADPEAQVVVVATGDDDSVIASVWRPCLRAGEDDEEHVWRCTEPPGVECVDPGPRESAAGGGADLTVVVHDSASASGPDIVAGADLSRGHVLLSVRTPAAVEDVTDDLEVLGRTTAVVDASDLRKLRVHLTEGPSWERAALDVVDELKRRDALAPLRCVRHLVVRFDLEGALLLELAGGAVVDARLVYDPAQREGALRRHTAGDVTALRETFAAGLATHLGADPDSGAVLAGVQCGLAATRALLAAGHGPSDAEPAPPQDLLAEALSGHAPPLPVSTVPVNLEGADAERWTILGSRAVGDAAGHPMHGMAQRLALEGLPGLWDVPRTIVGDFVTVDRSEIESLTALEQLVQVYLEHGPEDVPLSIGVFGQPGSGKSFVVRQLSKALLGEKPLEFNLSQFDGPDDLWGALHQVRDLVLSGRVPLVLFDEFDSKAFFWLQYLLAPMQDGRFQQGQVSHAVGKCIFAFAGGTAPSLAAFGDVEDVEGFKLAKGPDFKSRISGALDVLGPNPVEDEDDVAFPLRRALMIRGLLRAGDRPLDIDPGLLAGLLGVGRYLHGSRSLDKTSYYLRHRGTPGKFRLSDLPTAALLETHVDLDEVLAIAADPQRAATAGDLARAIHFSYEKGVPHSRWATDFANLPVQIQADNYAAAERMARVLSAAGLRIVARGDSAALTEPEAEAEVTNRLELLARAEHDGWMEFKRACGWRQGVRSKEKRVELLELQHNLLIPFDDLPPEEQDKDRDAVGNYVEQLALAGLAIALG